MHLFHKWTPWEIMRQDVLEMNDGMLFPYIIQKRHCQICKTNDIEIARRKWLLPNAQPIDTEAHT